MLSSSMKSSKDKVSFRHDEIRKRTNKVRKLIINKKLKKLAMYNSKLTKNINIFND